MNEHNLVPVRRQIVLMISHSCNLSCGYCYQTKKNSELMSVETAKRILENEFTNMVNDGRTEKAEIAYMGGEPLLNFDLIRNVSEWLWSRKTDIPYELTIRTNGTILTDAMKIWFCKNRSRIDVGLSMDGLSSMNRMNRTDQLIDWGFFRETWPSRKIKLVLYKDSVHLLAETVREMDAENIPFEIEIGEGFEWTMKDADILENQLVSLVPDYIDRPLEAVDKGLFSLRIADFFPEYPMREISFCGEFNNIIAYDADGSPCICHMFSTPVLGKDEARKAWHAYSGLQSIPFDPVCTQCPIHKNCKNCVGQNLRITGNVLESASRKTICNAVKAKARACSFFFLKRIEKMITQEGDLSIEHRIDAEKALRLLEEIPSPFCYEKQ